MQCCHYTSLTFASSSLAAESMGMGFRGMTKKCVGDTGDTSWNAMHCIYGGKNIHATANHFPTCSSKYIHVEKYDWFARLGRTVLA